MHETILKGRTPPMQFMLYPKIPRFDSTDIPYKARQDNTFEALYISECYMGIQQQKGKLRAKFVSLSDFANDGATFWQGGSEIDYLRTKDVLPYTYQPWNHKDQVQIYLIDDSFQKIDGDFEGLIIRAMHSKIRGDDKAVIGLTEYCRYLSINLWEYGVVVDTDSTHPYFFLATNLSFSTLGSPEHPIDPAKVSDKTIRIVDKTKDRAPKSEQNIIHCFSDLRTEFDDSAKAATQIITYDRAMPPEERRETFELMRQVSRW